jgi:hypothetical protein
MQVTLEASMSEPVKSAANALFLDDLSVGQRFSSGSHTIDAAQINSRFTSTAKPRKQHCSVDWPRAAGIPLRSP